MKTTNCRRLFSCFAMAFSLLNGIAVSAQNNDSDAKLLDDYIASKGYQDTIIFDASNIKQFWIDNSVLSRNNAIDIILSSQNNKSVPLKIQLAGVDQSLDCNIDVITNDSTVSFLVSDQSNKTISSDNVNNVFINDHIISSSFHLSEAKGFSFNLLFSSKSSDTISIKKIILSFSPNKDFDILRSPGTIKIGINDVTASTQVEKEDDNLVFSATGVNTRIVSQKRIYVADNELTSSIKIKNIGETPTRIYLGFAPYTQEGLNINSTSNLYKKSNKLLKVLSHEKNSKTVIVDSYPEEWEKGCSLALNAKEDLSDFPNCNVVEGKIQEINRLDDNRTEIIFNKAIKKAIPAGISVRIQDKSGAIYMYSAKKVIQPGEEITLSATVKKDDTLLEFSETAFCKGTYYVVPTLISYSKGSKEENKILISDYFISY